ncbi:hypothetical protein JVU11DRAFT_9901 [Chiua virens]|nr:hypothetical protein JVU11DRAFT_9901 [Chiua virens]
MSLLSAPLCLFAFLYLAARGLASVFEDSYVLVQDYYYVSENFSWPSASTWMALNDTLGGQLHTLRPWAAVCYIDDPLYDPAECQTVLSNYTNDYAREEIASALLWANWESCGYNNGCALNHSNPQTVLGETCHQGTTPPYGFAISSAQDASIIVKWAAAHNVKLTIKNTGHDYLGRSSGPSSLQILTHKLKGTVYVPDFVPQGSSAAPVPALKISAGSQAEEIHAIAEANNVMALLGTCLTVGTAGGFIQGGGNSRLSPTYGMTVDNLLEVEIVTADGVVRTINAAQDSDLFWAVRGGGAGSWGIIVSITIAALPPDAISSSSLTIGPDVTRDLHTLGIGFLALLGKHQNQIINAGIATTLSFNEDTYSLTFFWPARHVAVSLLYPFFDELRALSSDYAILSNDTKEFMYPSFANAAVEHVGPAVEAYYSYGGSTELASRLVPQSMLENPKSIDRVAEAIWEGLQIATAPLEDYPTSSQRDRRESWFLSCYVACALLWVMDYWGESKHVSYLESGCVQCSRSADGSWNHKQLSKRRKCMGNELAGSLLWLQV